MGTIEDYLNNKKQLTNENYAQISKDTKENKKTSSGGKIGNLGKLIVFKVSDKNILTFKDFNQEVAGRWSEHKRILQKPLLEFNGAESKKISFTIEINAMHGQKPRKMLQKIEKAVEKGTPYKLVIGGKKVGSNYWVIKNMTETWNEIYSRGELVRAELKISLMEYL